MKHFEKILILLILSLFISCKTTNEISKTVDDKVFEMNTDYVEEQLQQDETDGKYLIQETLVNEKANNEILIVEKPVYVPESKASKYDRGTTTGKEASIQSLKEAIQKPENYKYGTFYYQYNENFVYEIYAQPLHLTDIALEPGEIVTGTPLLSEDESVWELTAGVAKDPKTGADVQHLFVKPAYSNLDSTLIIITNKRVYHFNLKSYATTYMAMIKFTYPGTKNEWVKPKNEVSESTSYVKTSNPDLLSFDYSVSYNKKNKPNFVPDLVYDDGSFTYIKINEIILQTKMPVLFNEKNEIINYEVKDNVFIIPRLITKVSLRIGKEKVIIEKKFSKKKDGE